MKYARLFSVCIFSWVVFSSCSDSPKTHPFSHDLHLSYENKDIDQAVICFHGVGGSYRIKDSIDSSVGATLVSFNFPDHETLLIFDHPEATVYGSIDELLPALFVIKNAIVEKKFTKVTLYGHSAGGAALINCIAILNTSEYDSELMKIGMSSEDKNKIIDVIQNGIVILDTPLKSIDELVDHYGQRYDLEIIGSRYKRNGMNPIQSIEKWKGLSLRVLLHYQVPDKVLSNRDDDLFLEKIRECNSGTTEVLKGNDAGHSLPHPSLWTYYSQLSF